MGWNHQLVYNYNNRNWSWSDEGHWPFSSVKVFSGRTFSLARYWNPTATWSHRFATSQQGNDVFAGWNLWTLWHVGGLKNKDSKWWSCNAHRAVKVPLRICFFFVFALLHSRQKKKVFFGGESSDGWGGWVSQKQPGAFALQSGGRWPHFGDAALAEICPARRLAVALQWFLTDCVRRWKQVWNPKNGKKPRLIKERRTSAQKNKCNYSPSVCHSETPIV